MTEVDRVDRAALELTLQNGSEPLTSPLGGDMLDIKLDFIKPVFPIDEDKLSYKIVEAFRKNMEKHEGKKIGLQLSGGNDSTFSLYLLKKLFPDMDITGYHLYFGDPTRDERHFAHMAARHYDIPLNYIEMDVHKQIELIPECIQDCNVVMSGLVYSYGMMRQMAVDGMDVSVHSLGPDEYFGAYAFDKRYYERRPFFGMVQHDNKYTRELAKRYGTDRAFFVNNAAIMSGKRHVANNKYNMDDWYSDFYIDNLWVTMKRWMWERNIGGQYRINQQPANHFAIEVAFPWLEKNLAEYCFGCIPISVYNKRPMRELMRQWNMPEAIVQRGEDWNVGSGGKVGWCPSPKFYASFTKKFFPKDMQDVSGLKIVSDMTVRSMFTNYVRNNILRWIVTGDRRAQQIGLLLRMLEIQ